MKTNDISLITSDYACRLADSCSVFQVPGGELEESRVLSGVMVNKDVTHPRMRRYNSLVINLNSQLCMNTECVTNAG